MQPSTKIAWHFFCYRHRYLLKQIFVFTFGLCLGRNLSAQIINSGNVYIAGLVYANTDFTNASSAAYLNNGNFYLTKNFINNQSSLAQGTGTTSFVGQTLQKINGAQSPAFFNAYLNNAAGVQMNINISIAGIISPVAGSLYFNGYALTMGGKMDNAYTNTAAFNVTSTSDLNITGDAASGNKLYFDPSGDTLHNLTIISNATGVLGNALNITGGSKFGTVTADGNLNSAGFLTLKSNAGGDARVGKSAGKITNNATVERFIPARRAWRFLTVPFSSSAQSINQAWQEGYANTNLNCPPQYPGTPGYATEITYNGMNGYDLNTTNNPSIKIWQNNTWVVPGSTLSVKITDYAGYCLFVRGDRTICLIQTTSAIPDNTVLRATGILYQTGVNSVTKTYTGDSKDFFFTGNPYASAIDLTNVINGSRTASNGFDLNKVWVWDPKIGGAHGVGSYVTYSNGIWVPSGGSYPLGSNNLPFIQSGQAFMVQTNTKSASMQFKEDDKTATESNVFGKVSPGDNTTVYANLMLQDSVTLLDGVATVFNNTFSSNIDANDATKLWNFNENIALVRNDTTLAIEFRQIPRLTDTLFYRLYLAQQPYSLKIFFALPDYLPLRAWLADNYLHTQTEINLSDTTFYNFTPNPDTNSYRNRFMLIFDHQFNATPVPVTKITNQKNPGVTGNANHISITEKGVSINPNPVSTGGDIMLQFINMDKGRYEITISDIMDKPVIKTEIGHNGGDKVNYELRLNKSQASGDYIVRITNENGYVYITRLVIAD